MSSRRMLAADQTPLTSRSGIAFGSEKRRKIEDDDDDEVANGQLDDVDEDIVIAEESDIVAAPSNLANDTLSLTQAPTTSAQARELLFGSSWMAQDDELEVGWEQATPYRNLTHPSAYVNQDDGDDESDGCDDDENSHPGRLLLGSEADYLEDDNGDVDIEGDEDGGFQLSHPEEETPLHRLKTGPLPPRTIKSKLDNLARRKRSSKKKVDPDFEVGSDEEQQDGEDEDNEDALPKDEIDDLDDDFVVARRPRRKKPVSDREKKQITLASSFEQAAKKSRRSKKRANLHDFPDIEVVSDEELEEEEEEEEETNNIMEPERTGESLGDLILSAEGQTPVRKLPAAMNDRLREYQRLGIKFLFRLFTEGKGGILGDEMGLGKTVQTVGFIISLLDPSSPSILATNELEPHKPVLLVLPASVITNWEKEIKTWTRVCGIRYRVFRYHGQNRTAQSFVTSMKNTDILITSYETFRIDFEKINAIDWLFVVFDEVHKVKGRRTKLAQTANQLKTMRRYGLTGTVIQNNLEELWTLFDFVRPDYLGPLVQFRDQTINPIKRGQKRDASDWEVAHRTLRVKWLNTKFKDIVLRRDKSVIKDLLPEKTDHIVFCEMTELQTRVYLRALNSPEYAMIRKRVEKCACGSGKTAGTCCLEEDAGMSDWKRLVLPAIDNLLKIANRTRLDVEMISPKPNPKDPDKVAREVQFYKTAVAEDESEVVELINDSNGAEKLCGKLKTLRVLLQRWYEQEKKVIVFSYSTRMLDLIEKLINPSFRGKFCRLDGTTKIDHRQSIIDMFNTSSQKQMFLFLISTKAGGLGLNITSATVACVIDPSWNVTHDLQAQDRIHRLGQTKACQIFRFVSSGTIEEIVYNRQVYKQQMANVSQKGNFEKRYYQGVQGVKGAEGELFGLANLLKIDTKNVITKQIMDSSNEAENKSQVKPEEEGFRITADSANQPSGDKEDEELMKALFADNLPEVDIKPLDLNEVRHSLAGSGTSTLDPETEALLRSAGMMYHHNNRNVVGLDSLHERNQSLRAVRSTGVTASSINSEGYDSALQHASQRAAGMVNHHSGLRRYPSGGGTPFGSVRFPPSFNAASEDFPEIDPPSGYSARGGGYPRPMGFLSASALSISQAQYLSRPRAALVDPRSGLPSAYSSRPLSAPKKKMSLAEFEDQLNRAHGIQASQRGVTHQQLHGVSFAKPNPAHATIVLDDDGDNDVHVMPSRIGARPANSGGDGPVAAFCPVCRRSLSHMDVVHRKEHISHCRSLAALSAESQATNSAVAIALSNIMSRPQPPPRAAAAGMIIAPPVVMAEAQRGDPFPNTSNAFSQNPSPGSPTKGSTSRFIPPRQVPAELVIIDDDDE